MVFIEIILYDKFKLNEKIIINTANISEIEREGDGDVVLTMSNGNVYRTIEQYDDFIMKIGIN